MAEESLLSRVNARYAADLENAARRVIASGVYLRGEATAQFERTLAALCGVAHCVGTASGLDALRLSLRALLDQGILHRGDVVLTCAHTYIASLLPLTEFGLTPRLIDAAPGMYAPTDAQWLENATADVRAVLIVHLYGMPAATNATVQQLRARGLSVIEDCAQAIGAKSIGNDGKFHPVGAFSTAAAFSFYPSKNIGALGDAGAVVCAEAWLADAVRALGNYGSLRRYHNVALGYNSRIDELQAAFLNVKLPYLDTITEERRAIARTYAEHITNPLVALPQEAPGTRASWHQYAVRCRRRDDLRAYLDAHGVPTDVHYPTSAFRQPCYAGTFGGNWPEAEAIADEEISLPIAAVTPADAARIAHIINAFT